MQLFALAKRGGLGRLDHYVATLLCSSSLRWGVDVLPGSLALADVDLRLATMPDRGERLRAALQPVRAAYDTVLIDCPTGMGLVVVNALHGV